MNKWIVLGVIGLLLIMGYSTVKSSYNGMVNKDEEINGKWSEVENNYQRRADLIPNLVSTVKGYADFEKETLEAVINARAKATQTTIDPSNLSPESVNKFMAAQDGLSSALGKLMVVVERYPELKANQNFLELQAQLEGTENRITVARKKFNEATNAYNAYVRSFPRNIFASIFGFEEKEYFKAQAGAESAPKVTF